jgi:hypothetical protein
MTKSKRSKQRAWTQKEIRRLTALAKQKMSAAIVARALHRSLDSTKKKASRLGVPLGTAKRRWTQGDLRRLKVLAGSVPALHREIAGQDGLRHRAGSFGESHLAGFAAIDVTKLCRTAQGLTGAPTADGRVLRLAEFDHVPRTPLVAR